KRWADALLAAGDLAAARRVIKEAARALPEALELFRALETLGEPGPFEGLRVDGRALIAAHAGAGAGSGAERQAPAVLVLDRTVTRTFAGGARLTLTHNIVRVQSKAGVERWGEVRIPTGAEVLTLRTVKPDGSTREPEEISEKETVSAP